jgi:hypothetical protein
VQSFEAKVIMVWTLISSKQQGLFSRTFVVSGCGHARLYFWVYNQTTTTTRKKISLDICEKRRNLEHLGPGFNRMFFSKDFCMFLLLFRQRCEIDLIFLALVMIVPTFAPTSTRGCHAGF